MSPRSLDVLLGSLLVGHLARGLDGRVTFSMVESYKRRPRRPVLSQFFEDDLDRRYRGKPGKLPAFFANLVPEGVLRDVVETQAGITPGDDMALMALVGQDLAGAVVVRPSDHTPQDDAKTDDEDEDSARPRQPGEEGLRFSLAGAQLKFSMIRDDDKLTLDAWREHAASWPMLEDHRRALYKHWQRVPLLKRHGFDKLGPSIGSARPRRPRRSG